MGVATWLVKIIQPENHPKLESTEHKNIGKEEVKNTKHGFIIERLHLYYYDLPLLSRWSQESFSKSYRANSCWKYRPKCAFTFNNETFIFQKRKVKVHSWKFFWLSVQKEMKNETSAELTWAFGVHWDKWIRGENL